MEKGYSHFFRNQSLGPSSTNGKASVTQSLEGSPQVLTWSHQEEGSAQCQTQGGAQWISDAFPS